MGQLQHRGPRDVRVYYYIYETLFVCAAQGGTRVYIIYTRRAKGFSPPVAPPSLSSRDGHRGRPTFGTGCTCRPAPIR